jgi:hypothetical protein
MSTEVPLAQEEFRAHALEALGEYRGVVMLEDRNRQFRSGGGPVGVVGYHQRGAMHEPHVEWFPWTTTRNRLRCTVAYLQSRRHAKWISAILIRCSDADASWFWRLREFVPIYRVGRIPWGRPGGGEVLFAIRGKGRA